MVSPFLITGEMTVREAIARYPQVRDVLEKHGLGHCGGPAGSPEPIAFFARIHRVDGEGLLRDMNQAAGNGARPAPAPPVQRQESLPPDIYRVFVKTALIVALTAGWTLGAAALAALTWGWSPAVNWVGLFQAHGYAQLLGWIGLFIMGVAYHVVPRLKATELYSRSLAMWSYWLVLGALVVRALGQPILTGIPGSAALVVSSILLLAGVAVFVYVLLRTVARSPQPAAFFERYILGGAVWLGLTAAIGAGGAVAAAWSGLSFVPGPWNAAFLHAGLAGFVTLFILGITLRTVPAFLGLRPLNQRAFRVIFWVMNAGLVLTVGPELLAALGATLPGQLLAAGPALGLVAGWAYVYYLNLFRKPSVASGEGGLDRSYEPFIRVAYLWFLLATTLYGAVSVYRALGGGGALDFLLSGYRHGLAIGFVSLMTMGMASRMIAVFAGVRLHSAGLARATLVLVNLGLILRLALQLRPGAFGGASDIVLGLSGVVALAGLMLFAYNIWRTMDTRQPQQHEEAAMETPKTDHAITEDMKVGLLLDEFPQSLGVLLDHGLSRLKDLQERQKLVDGQTIAELARREGLDLSAVLADLNRVFGIVRGGATATEEGGPVTGNVIVGELLEREPELLEVFVKHGFVQLRDERLRTTMAKTVTIAMAAQIHGVSLPDLLGDLNTALRARA